MCAHPLVVGSHDFNTGNTELQKVHQLSVRSFLRNTKMRAAFMEQDSGLLLISSMEGLPVTSLHRVLYLFAQFLPLLIAPFEGQPSIFCSPTLGLLSSKQVFLRSSLSVRT